MKLSIKITTILLGIWSVMISPEMIWAAPYFQVTGPSAINRPYIYAYAIRLFPDNTNINTAQIVLNFDKTVLEGYSLSNLSSNCAFYAPADPSLGFGGFTTPYFYNDEKAVIACGFTPKAVEANPGTGVLLTTVNLKPITTTDKTTTLTLTDPLLKYIGLPVLPGLSSNLALSVYYATASANPTATPYPSPTPVNPRTVTSKDLTFVEIGTPSGNQTTASASGENLAYITPGAISNLDNSIPTPGPLSPRPTLAALKAQIASESAKGDILSLRSLRELLIPGKTTADKTVVMVNLLSTLAFLIILTILIWLILRQRRQSRDKISRFREVIAGEIAMILGKTNNSSVLDQKDKEELSKSLKDLEKGGP